MNGIYPIFIFIQQPAVLYSNGYVNCKNIIFVLLYRLQRRREQEKKVNTQRNGEGGRKRPRLGRQIGKHDDCGALCVCAFGQLYGQCRRMIFEGLYTMRIIYICSLNKQIYRPSALAHTTESVLKTHIPYICLKFYCQSDIPKLRG